MEHNTFLKPPKKEEEEDENEGLVPYNTLKFHPSTYDIKPHSPGEEVIMDELEGILGIEYDENFPNEEETDGHSYLHMNWEDELSTTQFFQDAELWDCNADIAIKAERSCGYWDFDDKKESLNLSLNYQEVLEAWSNRGPLWAPSKSYMGEVPVMEEEQNGNWSRRQASVMRYKEKRQSRLFSKKIRYEVRKLNADKRPRIKAALHFSSRFHFIQAVRSHLHENDGRSPAWYSAVAERWCFQAVRQLQASFYRELRNVGASRRCGSCRPPSTESCGTVVLGGAAVAGGSLTPSPFGVRRGGSSCVVVLNGVAVDAGDSDSDAHSDGIPEFYQPITAIDEEDDDEDTNEANSEHRIFDSRILSNGGDLRAENGMRSLNLSDEEKDSEEEEEEEVVVRMRAESAIATAFHEDESRRNAPLTAENASRVREAMRGISFAGFSPDWASRVPEEQLINQIQQLRHSPHSPA